MGVAIAFDKKIAHCDQCEPAHIQEQFGPEGAGGHENLRYVIEEHRPHSNAFDGIAVEWFVTHRPRFLSNDVRLN